MDICPKPTVQREACGLPVEFHLFKVNHPGPAHGAEGSDVLDFGVGDHSDILGSEKVENPSSYLRLNSRSDITNHLSG